MSPRRRWSFAWALGLVGTWLLACRAPSVEPPDRVDSEGPSAAMVDVGAPTEAEPALTLEERLDAWAVTADDFVRSELYTWTTPAQIEALRAGGPLLVADAGEDPSPFNRVLLTMVASRGPGHEIAALLEHGPGLTKRRYAWPNPFATVLGKGPRTYGEALIRVELSPDAVIARLEPEAVPPWSFFDAQGRPVSRQVVLDDPLRLGAIYHLQARAGQSIPFREVVLCNEAMIARWSVGTPAIAERIARERALVADLVTGPFAALSDSTLAWAAWPQWVDPERAPTLLSRWHRTLAFDNVRYRPSATALARLDQALADYDPTGPAIVGGTDVQASR